MPELGMRVKVRPKDLRAVDTPSDDEVPAYNAAQGKFEWKPRGAPCPHDKTCHTSPTLPDDDVHRTASPIDHPDGSITPAKLDATNSPAADYPLTYDATAGKFRWGPPLAVPGTLKFSELLQGWDPAYLRTRDAAATDSVRLESWDGSAYQEVARLVGGRLELSRAKLTGDLDLNNYKLLNGPDDFIPWNWLKTVDTPADGEVLTYNESYDQLEWKPRHVVRLADVVTSSNVTSIQITGLSLNDYVYAWLWLNVKNPTGSSCVYELFVNGDTDSTHYYSQYLRGAGTSTGAGRVNDARIKALPAGERGYLWGTIARDPGGYPRYLVVRHRETGSAVELHLTAVCKTATVSNITQLDLVASVSGGIGAGSRLVLWGVI